MELGDFALSFREPVREHLVPELASVAFYRPNTLALRFGGRHSRQRCHVTLKVDMAGGQGTLRIG